MSPGLVDGDYVITKTKPRSFRPGSIYVINHIDLGQIIKRLKAIENERLFFKGDNQTSTPDAIIAPVSPDRVLAKVVLVIGRSGIRRSPQSPRRT